MAASVNFRSEYELKQREYTSSQADYEASRAALAKQQSLMNSNTGGEHSQVAKVRAALVQAEFDLAETVARAPTDGYMTQNLLKPGMMATTLPLRPVMTFTHKQDQLYIGAFRQNSLQRLKPGDQAEFVFPSIPGKTFQGGSAVSIAVDG